MHMRPAELAAWLRTRVTATGANGIVVPFTDSLQAAIVARLCQLAVREAVLGALLPAAAERRAQATVLAQELQLPLVDVECQAAALLPGELTPRLEPLRRRPESPPEAAQAGATLSTRVSLAAMYYVAESLNCLIAGTLDRTDLTLGAFTRHGESEVDLLPLGNAFRREVVALARDLDLPPGVLQRARPAEEVRADAGLSHDDLERYLADGPDAVPPAVALKVERLMRESERKRSAADVPEVEAGSGLTD